MARLNHFIKPGDQDDFRSDFRDLDPMTIEALRAECDDCDRNREEAYND